MSKNFRKTREDELDKIMQIIEDARSFMKDSGLSQWQDGYPDRQSIKEDIKNGKTYVLTVENEIAAAALVTFSGEPDYDVITGGSWLNSGTYAAVHKVVAASCFRGKGVTYLLFENIEALCRKKGVFNIKIDTHRDNLRMQGFLKKAGFIYCGEVSVFTFGNDKQRLAYQKIL